MRSQQQETLLSSLSVTDDWLDEIGEFGRGEGGGWCNVHYSAAGTNQLSGKDVIGEIEVIYYFISSHHGVVELGAVSLIILCGLFSCYLVR